jgi:hypothetical protein
MYEKLIVASSAELFNTRYVSLPAPCRACTDETASPSNAIRISPIKDLSNLLLPPKCGCRSPLLYFPRRLPSSSLDRLICRLSRKLSRRWTLDNQVPYPFVLLIDDSLMNVRHRLEKSSGTKYSDDNISPEMKSLNKKFGIAHGYFLIYSQLIVGISSLLNLGYLISAITQIIYIADALP